jgi:hypothetical protein
LSSSEELFPSLHKIHFVTNGGNLYFISGNDSFHKLTRNPILQFHQKNKHIFLRYLISVIIFVLIPFMYFQITIVKTFYSASIKHVEMSMGNSQIQSS